MAAGIAETFTYTRREHVSTSEEDGKAG